MKRLCLACLFFAMANASFAALDTRDYGWTAPIEAPPGVTGFALLPLPPNVFDQSERGLNDLRVLDDQGNLAPHLIEREASAPSIEWKKVDLLNRVFQPGVHARVTLDFGSPVRKNRIRVDLSGDNYRRKALVEGSVDGQQWDRLDDNLFLFAIHVPGHSYRVDTLRLPENNFRYLRLTVFVMEDEQEITINGVEAAFEKPAASVGAELPVANIALRFDEKNRETILEMDLGYRNLPIEEVRLSIATPFFHRPYVLEGRNATRHTVRVRTETGWNDREEEAPWSHAGGGVLYRLAGGSGTAELTSLERVEAPYRFLRVRFFEGDNPPLSLDPKKVSVLWRQPKLFFEIKPGRTYSLYWGNPKANAPAYDLAGAIPDRAGLAHGTVKLGPPVAIAKAPKIAPWTERHSGLMTALFLAVALAVGAFLARSLMLRHTAPGS